MCEIDLSTYSASRHGSREQVYHQLKFVIMTTSVLFNLASGLWIYRDVSHAAPVCGPANES